MKFFKHFVDADTGSLNELMNRLGVEAYGRYWLFTALCVSTLEKPKGEPYKEEDMRFSFNSRQLREKLRIKSTNLGIFLGICSELTLFQWELSEDKFNFYFPNILKSMDRDSKRARVVRAVAAPKRKRKSKEKELRINSVNELVNELGDEGMRTLLGLFPQDLLDQELPFMAIWLKSNPPKKNYLSFATNWLRKSAKDRAESAAKNKTVAKTMGLIGA